MKKVVHAVGVWRPISPRKEWKSDRRRSGRSGMDSGCRWRTSHDETDRKKEVIEADMVLLAMGFLKPEQPKFAKNVFLAGDAETGASLVVRAMAGGRKAAAEIDAYLTK